MRSIKNEDYKRILNGWNHFAMMESITSTIIHKDMISEENSVDVKNKYENGLKISDKNAVYIEKRFIKREIKDTDEILLFFPMINRMMDGKKVCLPLFAYKITPYRKSIVTTKEIEFNFNEPAEDLHIMKEVFENILQIPEAELPNDLSIIDFFNEFMDTEYDEWPEAYYAFIEFLNNEYNVKVSEEMVIAKGDTTYEFETYSTQTKLMKDIGLRFSDLGREYLGVEHKDQLDFKAKKWYGSFNKIHQLSEGQAKVLLAKKTNSLVPVKGGPGTGKTTLLLSTMAENFTSSILEGIIDNSSKSSLMVLLSTSNKAIENIEEEIVDDEFLKDRKDFYLFLGAKAKINLAVQRIESFIEELQNKEIDDEKYRIILDRIDEIFNIMEANYTSGKLSSKNQEKLEKLKNEFSSLEKIIMKMNEKIKSFQELGEYDIEFLKDKISSASEQKKINERIFFLKEKLSRYKYDLNTIIEKISFIDDNITYKGFNQEELNRQKKLLDKKRSIEKEFLTEVNKDKIDKSKVLKKAVLQLDKNIKKVPFYMIEIIFNKKGKLIDVFWEENEDDLINFGIRKRMLRVNKIKDLYDFFVEFSILEDDEIYELVYQGQNIDDEKEKIDELLKKRIEADRLLSIKTGIEKNIDEIMKDIEKEKEKLDGFGDFDLKAAREVVELKNNLLKEHERFSIIKKEIEILEEEKKYTNKLSSEDITEICRVDHVKENRELFELVVEYNELNQIKEKANIIRALNSLIKMLKNEFYADVRSEWAGRENEFYKYIAMVYPMMTITIASFPKLVKVFSDGFFNSNKQWIMWNKFKLPPIDLLMSDESGMTKVHSLFPPIFYSKSAIVVGDEDQLGPIINVSEHTIEENIVKFFDGSEGAMYSPGYVPAFSRASGQLGIADSKGRSIILNEHRRCQPKIARLFKRIVPDNYQEIEIKTEQLTGERLERFEKFGNKNIIMYDVVGSIRSPNINDDEIDKIDDVLVELENAGYDIEKDVGIITPYKGQAKVLTQRFRNRLGHNLKNKKIGTVHSFQGSEFEVVIFTSVITGRKSPNFINAKRNMLNVIVSRAKDVLIIVGDKDKLERSGGTLKIVVDDVEEFR